MNELRAVNERSIDGIEYASAFGYRPLVLDLYLPPEGGAPPPVVLFLHGGGWALGDRKLTAPCFGSWSPGFFERIAAAGLAVASADYRLSGEAVFPAQLHDAWAALRWLRRHGEEYGFDGSRVVAWGTSAGAHLAALLALIPAPPPPRPSPPPSSTQPTPPSPIPPTPPSSMIVGTSDQYLVVSTHDHEDAPLCGVVDWYGIADLVALGPVVGGPMEHDSVESPEGRLIGGRVSANPELARAASPVSYVHPGAPPFQIKHGLADAGVPAAQSQALASLLTDAGVDVETEWVEGADHMWMGASPEQVEAIFESSLSFARKVTGL